MSDNVGIYSSDKVDSPQTQTQKKRTERSGAEGNGGRKRGRKGRCGKGAELLRTSDSVGTSHTHWITRKAELLS